MLPLAHLIIGLIFGFLLLKLGFLSNYFDLAAFVIVSVFIDLDHFLYFLLKLDFKSVKKTFRRAFGFSETIGDNFYIFHAPELNLILLIFGFFYHLALVIFAANMVHIICDILWHYYTKRNWDRFKDRSLIWNLIRK